MTGPHPVLPPLLVLTLAFIGFVFLAWRLQRRGAITGPRLVLAAVACVYGAGVLKAVLFPFPIEIGSARDDLVPWRLFVNLVPLVTALQDPIGIVLNVALFVPLGLILPLVLRAPSAGTVVMTGFLISLGIELVQLLTDVTVSTGRVADVDDLLGNTAGVLLGYVLFRIALCVPGVARVADALAWPSAERHHFVAADEKASLPGGSAL